MTSKADGHISQTISDLIAQYYTDRLDPDFAAVRWKVYKHVPESRVKTADEIAKDKILASVQSFKIQNDGLRSMALAIAKDPGLKRHVLKNREMMGEALAWPRKMGRNTITVMADGPKEMEMGLLRNYSSAAQVKRIVLVDGIRQGLFDCVASLHGDPRLAKFDLVQQDLMGGVFDGVNAIFEQEGHTALSRLQAVTRFLDDVAGDDFPIQSKISGQATVRLSSLVLSQMVVYLRSYLDDKFKAHHSISLEEWLIKFNSLETRSDLAFQQELASNGISGDDIRELLRAWGSASEKIQSRYVKNLADRTSDFVFFSDTVAISEDCSRELTLSRQDFDNNKIPSEGGKHKTTSPVPMVFYKSLERDLHQHFTLLKTGSWTWISNDREKEEYQVIKKTKNHVTFSIPYTAFIVEGWILRPKHAPRLDFGLLETPARMEVADKKKAVAKSSVPKRPPVRKQSSVKKQPPSNRHPANPSAVNRNAARVKTISRRPLNIPKINITL